MTLSFAEQAEAVFDQFTEEERAGLSGVEVLDSSCPHPFLDEFWLLSELIDEDGDQPRIRIYQASFQHVAEKDGAFNSAESLRGEVAQQATRHHEDRACAQQYPTDDAVMAAHASFREEEPLLPGWYRQGALIQPFAWAVDNDVFIELPLRHSEFLALRGTSVVLRLPGADMELDVPAEAAPDETWQIEGAGLFEEDPDIDLDALEDDEEVTGQFGDLHVILVVTGLDA
jgi:hypothetical protein